MGERYSVLHPSDKPPDEHVWTTFHGNDYVGWFSGTSASCPIVTGVVALMLSIDPTLNCDAIASRIAETADRIGTDPQPIGPGYVYGGTPPSTGEVGYGRINAYKALALTNGAPDPPTLSLSIVYEEGIGYPRLSWSSPAPDIEKYEIWRRLTGTGLPGILEMIYAVVRDANGSLATSHIDHTLSMVGSGQYTATYQVKAFDAVDLFSGLSNEASVRYGDA